MAVSAVDNRIKILANDSGRCFLQEAAFDFGDSAKCVTESFGNVSFYQNPFVSLFCGNDFSSKCSFSFVYCSQLSVGSLPFPRQGVAGGNGIMVSGLRVLRLELL